MMARTNNADRDPPQAGIINSATTIDMINPTAARRVIFTTQTSLTQSSRHTCAAAHHKEMNGGFEWLGGG